MGKCPRHSTSVKSWVSRFFQKEEKVVEESEYLRIMLGGDLESDSKPMLVNLFFPFVASIPRGGVHNMLRVWVCAAHMGGFLGPKFSKQGSLFWQIFHKQGWVIQKIGEK